MASITAIAERPSPGGSALKSRTSLQWRREETGLSGSPSVATTTTTTTKKSRPPDALSLLKNRPGIDGAPLGSPAASPASPGHGGVEDDPAIANVFYGLKPPAADPVPQKRRGGGGKAAPALRRVTARAATGGSPSGSTAAGAGAARPLSAGRGRAVGGGKSTLSRTGKELVCSGGIGGVGVRGGGGDGNGGEGALSSRVLGGVTAR